MHAPATRRPTALLRAAAVLGAVWAVGLLAVLVSVRDVRLRAALIDLTWPLVDLLVAAVLGLAAWRSQRLGRRVWLAWGLFAAAELCTFAGDVVWGAIDVAAGSVPFPSWADPLFLAYYPLFVLGILALPAPRQSMIEQIRTLLDAGIVMLAAMLVYWNFILGPKVAAGHADPRLALTLSLAFPVFDLLLLFGLLVLLSRRTHVGPAGPLLLLAASMAVMIAYDAVYSYQSLQGAYTSGGLLDILAVVYSLLAGLAGARQAATALDARQPPPSPARQRPDPRPAGQWFANLPYLWLFAAYLLLSWGYTHRLAISTASFQVAVGGIIVLVAARQALVLWENNTLARRLKKELAGREQAEAALRGAHAALESEVQARTAELRQTNESLQQEIADRTRAEEALRQRNRELALLNQAGQAFNSTLDLDHVLATVLEQVTHLLDATTGRIWLADRDTGELVCRLSTQPEGVQGRRLAPGQGVAGWVAREGASVVVADLGTDTRQFIDADQHIGPPMRSILAVPIQVRGETIGALQLLHSRAGHFQPAHLTLVESLAGAAASAIENARLYEESDRLRAYNESLFENAPVCLLAVDLQYVPPLITRANRQSAAVYRRPAAEFAAMPLEAIFLADCRPVIARVVDAVRTGTPITIESVNQRSDGTLFPVRVSTTPEPGNAPRRIIVAIEDISGEKERRSEEEAIAEERRRIAREIHDGLAQDLASLRMRARLWHDLLDQDPARMHAELDAMREFLRDKIREVRRSIFALRPVALDELGFFPAVRRYAADFGQQYQLYVEVNVRGTERLLPPGLEPVLFRILQEALNNAGKHARAAGVWIEIDLDQAGRAVLEVRDDGIGFDPAGLAAAVDHGHLGLAQLRERIEELGGTFELSSRPGCGTQVRASLPLTKPVRGVS